MKNAVGTGISIKPLLKAVDEAMKVINDLALPLFLISNPEKS